MPAATRRQCGCTCANQSRWEPAGDTLPSAMCSACSGSPCEYLVDFGCGDFFCDEVGLGVGGSHNGLGGGILSLPRDACLFEDSCVYSTKWNTNGVAFDMLAIMNARYVGARGECTYRQACPAVSESCWYKFFGTFGSLIETISNGIRGAIPTFGCQRNDWSATYDQPCGWYDFAGLDADQSEAWAAFLADEATYSPWTLTISGATATLVGRDDTGTPIVTYSGAWTCPDPLADDNRVTLTMEDYPGENCPGKFPKSVCVMPGYADAPECAVDHPDCCDPGAASSYLDVNLGDCGGAHEVEIVRNVTLPSGVTDPGGVCGYFWGTISTDCGYVFGVLTYCDGEDWHVDLWCSLDGWHEIDTATATLTQCCPGATYTWTWSGDWGDCCCTEEPPTVPSDCCDVEVSTILTATITSTCGSCNGLTGALEYDSGQWTGTGDVALTLQCISFSGKWAFIGSPCGGLGDSATPVDPTSCDPLLIEFTGVTITSGPCAGQTYNVTITA